MKITLKWLEKSTDGAVAYTPGNVAMAKAILKEGWSARAAERGLSAPADLSGACKFASLFVKLCFGGALKAMSFTSTTLFRVKWWISRSNMNSTAYRPIPASLGTPTILKACSPVCLV
ncbi:hypothetical protein [Comamonas thiooxydans]|uniref:hypothetical protein n=1 Tax=Comamonas thiooxydans TaxID=363952 RepID=UPI001186D9F3|nr:hypothetical protein [Comamonas thiooxydans]